MIFKHHELEVEITRTARGRGQAIPMTEHVRETLAQAIRASKPSTVQFDGDDCQVSMCGRSSRRTYRFMLDGVLLNIQDWKKDGMTGRYYR